MNGLLVIAVDLSLPEMGMSAMLQHLTAYGFIYVAWSYGLIHRLILRPTR